MGKRGPQPGFRAAAKATALARVPTPTPAATAPPVQEQVPVQEPQRVLSAADRENPAKLSGEALRNLGHSRGLARSLMEGMDDEKVRRELSFVIARQYEAA